MLLTREPGGTPLGERIRELVLARHAIDDPLTELMLFEAARAHLVATVIRPALDRGATVLCDRFAASSVAYQGFGRGLGRELVEQANAIATAASRRTSHCCSTSRPSAASRVARAMAPTNHFDAAEAAFHERVRAGFLELARESPDTWRIIDASQPLDAVVAEAYAAISNLIGAAR